MQQMIYAIEQTTEPTRKRVRLPALLMSGITSKAKTTCPTDIIAESNSELDCALNKMGANIDTALIPVSCCIPVIIRPVHKALLYLE